MPVKEKLLKYLYYAPDEVQAKYRVYNDNVYFNGLKFSTNKVEYLNIYIFYKENLYQPRYLDITSVFKDYERDINPYHLTLIIKDCLKKYHRESNITESHIPLVELIEDEHKPKIRYQLKKHRGRFSKFIEVDKDGNQRKWNYLLHRAIQERLPHSPFKQSFRERPDSMFFLFKER